MRSAMARFLTVNDFSGSPPAPRGNQRLNFDPEPADADSEFGVEPACYGVSTILASGTSTTAKNRSDQGPCLYFGPQGQRCSRPALVNGFCARHTPEQLGQSASLGAALPAAGRKPRIVAIGLAALVILDNLWPIISEVFRELVRLLHAH
jgi:hypothetical protein